MKWTSIEKFAKQGITFVLGLIMARLLTPDDYGIVGMITIFIAISRSFIDSGFGNALIRKLDRTDTDYSTVFYFNVVVSVFFYLLLFFIAPWVADFYNEPILCPIMRVLSINLLINALKQIQTTKLTIELNFRVLAIRTVVSSLLSGIIGVVCAYFKMGVWALVIQSMSGSVISLFLIWSYVGWRPKWVFSWDSFHSMFSYGSKLLIAGLINTVYNNLTPLVIGKFFSAKDLGYYNRGTHFAKVPVDIVNGVLGKVTFPILSKLQNDRKRLVAVYRKYISSMSLCIFFAGILLAAIAKPVITFLLTDKWSFAIIYLQIYAFSKIFDHINTINCRLIQVIGRSDISLRMEIIKKTISTIILFSSIPFGVIGICISKIIYTQIAIIINTYYTGKLFGLGYRRQWGDFVIYLIASVIACLPAYLFTFLNLPHLVSIAFGLITAPLLYWLLLRKNSLMKEILGDIKKRFIKRKQLR